MKDDLGYTLLFCSEKIVDHIPDKETRKANPRRIKIQVGDFIHEFGTPRFTT
jgi:hypothetical protein